MMLLVCVKFLNNEYSEYDLFFLLRRYAVLWQKVLDIPVNLGFRNGNIDVESSFPSFSCNPFPKTERRQAGDNEKAIYIETIRKLNSLLSKLTVRQREAIFWRYMDNSEYRQITNSKMGLRYEPQRPSNRELAAFLGISHVTFRERLIRGLERLGCTQSLWQLWLDNSKGRVFFVENYHQNSRYH